VETIGLIAGQGRFPTSLARRARSRGVRIVAVALRCLADPALAREVPVCEWVHLGEFGRLLEVLQREGAREVVLAGKVPKGFLWQHRQAVRPDDRALAFLAGLRDRRDDTLLGAVAELLEQEGFRLREQAALAPDLYVTEGPLGRHLPSPRQRGDIRFGWPVAKALGALDVGQTVVVQNRAVLALEAVEGTDAAIRRGCALGEVGACVIKVAKPHQDLRFDVPTVGPETLRCMCEGRAAVLALEAGRTVMLEREATLARADAAGIAVVGIPGEGPAAEPSP